jgi:hypothetical protein
MTNLSSLRTSLVSAGLVASFFLPYIYGGILRVDHGIAILAICYVFLHLLLNTRISVPRDFKPFFVFSFVAVLYAAVRLFLFSENLLVSAQYTVQYSYLFSGIALYLATGPALRKTIPTIIWTLALTAIVINLIAVFQLFSPSSELVLGILDFYGGRQQDPGTYAEYGSKAEEILLGGGQAISIFTGMQGLAVFNLFIIALAFGFKADKSHPWHGGSGFVVLGASVLAIVGGVLTGSKTFVFGLGLLLVFLALARRGFRWWLVFAGLVFAGFLGVAREYSYQLAGILEHVWNLDVSELFASRFGHDGYLTKSLAVGVEPFTLIFGLGEGVTKFAYADCQFLEVVLAGGLPLFALYYAALFSLLYACWKNRDHSSYARPLLALGATYIVGGIGMDIHFQARTIILWVLLNLLLLSANGRRTHQSRVLSNRWRDSTERTLTPILQGAKIGV